jgi:peroxidase
MHFSVRVLKFLVDVVLSVLDSSVPSSTDGVADLIESFRRKGLSADNMVTLSDARTIGRSRCSFSRQLARTDPSLDTAYAEHLRTRCLWPRIVHFNAAVDKAWQVKFVEAMVKMCEVQVLRRQGPTLIN